MQNLDKYYINSEVQYIDHLSKLSSTNQDFLMNVKRSMSMETILNNQEKLKQIYKNQKKKNLTEKDV